MAKINKQFVSEIDKRLAEFNATHAKSAAQQAEIDKYSRIYEQRDKVDAPQDNDDDSLWR